MKGQLSAFATALSAQLIGDDGIFDGACIDTRLVKPGMLFFALPGSRVDGHEFVADAGARGAAAAVVDHPVVADVPQLVVKDVAAALDRSARLARAGFVGPVVGVTGSNGKTTVKQMIATILAEAGTVVATEGNLNNHLGVPLTLMRLDTDTDRAVIEMGANHPGEIGHLAATARPDVGVITNAGTAHLEGFGSREGIARAKGELFIRLPATGTAVINADDHYADLWHELAAGRRIITFSMDEASSADIRAGDIQADGDGTRFTLKTPEVEVLVHLDLAGQHNVANALAAAGVATALGLSGEMIAAGLSHMAAVAGRLVITPIDEQMSLVDDSYNANPDSLAAALSWLGRQQGEHWAVFGDMAELGDYATQAHRDAGHIARDSGITHLFATGPFSRLAVEAFGENGHWYPDHEQLDAALLSALANRGKNHGAGSVTILVKGSRSARMDRVASTLRDRNGCREGASC